MEKLYIGVLEGENGLLGGDLGCVGSVKVKADENGDVEEELTQGELNIHIFTRKRPGHLSRPGQNFFRRDPGHLIRFKKRQSIR